MRARKFRQAAADGDLQLMCLFYHTDKTIVDSAGPDSGKTALHQAANSGHANIVEWLCKRGAKINLQDKDGNTPINLAAQSVKCTSLFHKIAVIDVLRKAKADVLLPNNAKQTLLMNMLALKPSVVSRPLSQKVLNGIIGDIENSALNAMQLQMNGMSI